MGAVLVLASESDIKDAADVKDVEFSSCADNGFERFLYNYWKELDDGKLQEDEDSSERLWREEDEGNDGDDSEDGDDSDA